MVSSLFFYLMYVNIQCFTLKWIWFVRGNFKYGLLTLVFEMHCVPWFLNPVNRSINHSNQWNQLIEIIWKKADICSLPLKPLGLICIHFTRGLLKIRCALPLLVNRKRMRQNLHCNEQHANAFQSVHCDTNPVNLLLSS